MFVDPVHAQETAVEHMTEFSNVQKKVEAFLALQEGSSTILLSSLVLSVDSFERSCVFVGAADHMAELWKRRVMSSLILRIAK